MNFVLTYRGILKSNGRPKHKNEIRQYFSPQLIKATHIYPAFHESIYKEKYSSFYRDVNGKKYIQLINSGLCLLADLDILILSQGELGGIINAGGDIDNRLKTLFDALTVPTVGQQMDNNENGLNCLLQDDKLISGIRVVVEPLLNIPVGVTNDYVELIIKVKTRFSKVTIENIGFA